MVSKQNGWRPWILFGLGVKTATEARHFRTLFMSRFFPASARHAKAWKFLEFRMGAMTVLEYVAKFTQLTDFIDDYVATDMAKVRKFENGLKLSIQGKIVGLLLQDMESMVRTAMASEREVNDAKSI